jgi:hypothetical protein
MFHEGGCGHWRANEQSIMKCRYVVATRNRRSSWSEGGEDHGAAFLVGEINGVIAEGNRFIIAMSRYARINVPNAWTPGGANPVHYERFETLGKRGRPATTLLELTVMSVSVPLRSLMPSAA